MKIVRVFTVGVVSVLLGACSLLRAPAPEPIQTEADFNGFVTELRPDEANSGLGHVLVESQSYKIISRYDVTITDETLIFRKDGDSLLVATFDELEAEPWVRIWFSGPVIEGFPGQATAAQLVILGQSTSDFQ